MKTRVATALPLMAIVLAILFLGSNLLIGAISIVLFAATYGEARSLFRKIRFNQEGTRAMEPSDEKLSHQLKVERGFLIGLAICLLAILFLIPRAFIALHWRPFLTLFGLLSASSFLFIAIRFIRIALRSSSNGNDFTRKHARWAEWLVGWNMALAMGLFAIYHALPFRGMANHATNSLLVLLVSVWAGDIAGILIGNKWGKRKMAPLISPGKTWEGAWGNFAFASIVGVVLGPLVGLGIFGGLLAGALAGTIGQIGDLTESAMKRLAGEKDSGKALPGHGGFYDRLDSLIAASSFFWIPLVLFLR